MHEAVAHSPWWYRFRGYVMGLIYFASFEIGYVLAFALHLDTRPVALLFGTPGVRAVLAAGCALALAGWLLRAWGTSYLRAEVVWNYDALANKLYVAGPFRYTRNPLYLGNLLLAAAIGLFAPPIGALVIVLGQLLFIGALIREEERGLRAQYGSEFDRYRAIVPRLFPRIVPAKADDVPHASYLAALRSETLMAGFVATFATFAIFGLRAEPYAWLFALAGVLYQYGTRTRPS